MPLYTILQPWMPPLPIFILVFTRLSIQVINLVKLRKVQDMNVIILSPKRLKVCRPQTVPSFEQQKASYQHISGSIISGLLLDALYAQPNAGGLHLLGWST